MEAHCSVLMCEALLNELAAAALFLPAEREPALMVRRLARSGLLFESPRQSEPEPELLSSSYFFRFGALRLQFKSKSWQDKLQP